MRTDAYAVLVDFGSTYTKVVVADLRQGDIVLTWREPSTVATDATVALTRCFAKCRDTIGGAAFEAARKLASSSAAGGLRMGVVGLSRSLSTTAGRNAAFGAGAKILGTFCGHLTKEDVAALSSLPLEIVLFCGGYDGGGVRTLRHNAEMLASSRLHIPFVYAGNTAAAADVRSIFGAAHKEIFVSHNITPCVGGMNSAPVAAVIRDLFLHRIINMKGLEKVVPLLDRVVMPTPAAVLAAGKLLAQGTNAVPGMGPLMIVDIGGATTVAATMFIASLAGIKVFATGGIGGVHRGAETTMDISADLTELGRTPVAVVCAGAKSVLDIGLTLEYLETQGVPVVGFRTNKMPAFYTRDSGYNTSCRCDSVEELSDMVGAMANIPMRSGMVIVNPIPKEFEADEDMIDRATTKALREAEKNGITGRDVTPFLLARIAELTEGASLKANIALVYNNVRLAASVAAGVIQPD